MPDDSSTNNNTSIKPTGEVTVKMYDVGFGDCFLLSVKYDDDSERRVLIDCGTIKGAGDLTKAVKSISKECKAADTEKGRVHVMIFTHRHADHISAFGSKGRRKLLLAMDPDVVVQPWTEDPLVLREPERDENGEIIDWGYGEKEREYIADLVAAGEFAELHEYGFDDSLTNKDAICELAKLHNKCSYVKAGDSDFLDAVLPGVKVWVLGPPAGEDLPTGGSHKNYWEHHLALALTKKKRHVAPRPLRLAAKEREVKSVDSSERWFIDRIETDNAESVKRLVREYDDDINDTSLVLLFQIGDVKLLFAGDAEKKNWDHILADSSNIELLKDIDLYKVGHHGSGNATPKDGFWMKLDKIKDTSDRLITLLSSTAHGSFESVPASELWKQLQDMTDLRSTHEADNEKTGPWEVTFPRP